MSAIEITNFFVECPYCNKHNQISTRHAFVNQSSMNVTLCYPEDGGCDNYFAYKLDIKVQSQTYTITKHHKIWEGM